MAYVLKSAGCLSLRVFFLQPSNFFMPLSEIFYFNGLENF